MVLVYTESSQGQFKKASFEALSYATQVAAQTGSQVKALVLGDAADVAVLGTYGATEIIQVQDARLNTLNAGAYAKAIADAATACQAEVLVFSNTLTGKAVAPRVAARLKAGLASQVISLPDLSQGFVVKKSVFAGKAYAYVRVETPIKLVAITPNTFALQQTNTTAQISSRQVDFTEKDFAVRVEKVETVSGTVPLSEAELVVSGGRGMKGPEHWGILEELAQTIGATLACSRPVADSHWRPHHEHVGQTGGTIRPNLYLAVGISGAIQHLAGVNSSKTIVVINKDPEAPFFKAADYGVLGDDFEVVPRLTEAFRRFKAKQNA